MQCERNNLCGCVLCSLVSQFGHAELSCYPVHALLQQFVILSTGTMTGVTIFSVVLRIPDSVLVLCVMFTRCAQKLTWGFAPKSFYLYIGRCNFITVLNLRLLQQ
jgi:hypothetical protein